MVTGDSVTFTGQHDGLVGSVPAPPFTQPKAVKLLPGKLHINLAILRQLLVLNGIQVVF
jgi:hypothetical protein